MDPLPATTTSATAEGRSVEHALSGSSDVLLVGNSQMPAETDQQLIALTSASPPTTYRPTSGYASSQTRASIHPGPPIANSYARSSRSARSATSPSSSLYAGNPGFGVGPGPGSSSSKLSSNLRNSHYSHESQVHSYPPYPSPVVVDPRWPSLSSASHVMR